MSKILWVLFQLLLALLCVPVLFGDSYPLWGNLQPGSHGVGFTARFEYDYSRVFHPKRDADGNLYEGNRARPIEIAIWYPAARSSAKTMRYEEYAYLLANELNFDPLTAASKQEAVNMFTSQRKRFTRASDKAIQTLLQSKTSAIRDAAPVKGKFPLLVYAPGSGGTAIENTILCEYLASRGYIVAALPSMGAYTRSATTDLTGFYAYMQDIEFVIGYMHKFPNVDADALGLIGFSMGGGASILVQMRNFDVDAMVYLDTGLIFDVVETWFGPSNYYTPTDLRAPQLYLVRKDARGLAPKQLDKAPFAETYVFLSPEGYRHPDFLADGMFTGLIDGYLPADAKNAKELFEYSCETTGEFLDGYIKRDKTKIQALQERMKRPAIFAGSHKASAGNPPREMEIAQMIRDGKLAAVRQIAEKYSGYPLFKEGTLNNVGYEYLFRGDRKLAVEILEMNAQIFSNSANAQDSLSEAYEVSGDTEKSLAHAKKAMELLNSDNSMEASRKQLIQQAVEQRLKKLQRSK